MAHPIAVEKTKPAHAANDLSGVSTQEMYREILTRLGEGSRMVVTGDPTQIDLPPGVGSGLVEAASILDGVKGIGITTFVNSDIVRHPLVGRIVQAYEKRQAKLSKGK